MEIDAAIAEQGFPSLPADQEEFFARTIWQAAMETWSISLGGQDWPAKKALRERMDNPVPGDLVVEQSAGIRQRECAQAVGWLIREVREPIPSEGWDVETDGPLPDERVYYIRNLNGAEARWVNAKFYQVPTRSGWWDRSPAPRASDGDR